MKIERVVPNIQSDRIQESRDFYEGFLGLYVGMDLGWVRNEDHSADLHPQISIEVDDVEQAHEMAVDRTASSSTR